MEQQFTREEFYDLIWSKPIKDLAPDFGISDVALGKICRQLGIAMPGRGYWAKLKAGARLPPKPKLPRRGFGESDMVTIGQESWTERKERFATLEDLPPKPEFIESFAELAERAKGVIGNIALPKTLSKPHRIIETLLKNDEARREKTKDSPYSWELGDLFSSPFEKRRLRMLNAIFNGLEKANLRVNAKTQNPMDFWVAAHNGSQISFTLDHPSTKDRHTYIQPSLANRPANEKLRLEIKWYWNIPSGLCVIWEDKKDHQIEEDINDIVANIVIALEMSFRTWKVQQYENLIEEQETRRKQEKAAQEAKIKKERLRLERARKAQLDKLFGDAAAYRLAKDLREYVAEVLSANESDEHPVSSKDLEAWAAWAREQADSIDPVKSRAFLGKAPEPTESEDEDEDEADSKQGAQSAGYANPDTSYRSEAWHPNRWYTKLHRP